MEEFRVKVQSYLRQAGISQKALAQELGLNSNVLSRKLNGISGASLTHPEIKQIIRILAEWEAVTSQLEVIELLSLANLKATSLSEAEWKAPPLSRLDKLEPVSLRQNDWKEIAINPSHRLAEATQTQKSPSKTVIIPASATQLVGREWAIDKVSSLLQQPHVRLVTLIGTAGTGKTRLALEVARKCTSSFRNGVIFVNLAPITDPTLLPAVLAQTLQLKEIPNQSWLETLQAGLREKEILLVLDNFEQIVEAGGLMAELLQVAPGLKTLVTSRVVLRLYGEYQFGVPPLDLPDLTELPVFSNLKSYESIRLFEERAKAVKSDFELTPLNAPLVAEICVSLDGLPLAIELAAARLRILPVEALLAHLQIKGARLTLLSGGSRNLPERQQTLHNTLEWGYDLLDEKEKCLFRSLGVFVGGWSLEAAAAICPFQSNPLEELSSLVDKSLVRATSLPNNPAQVRFEMLQTLQEFALEKLLRTNEATNLKARHALYFLEQLEKSSPGLVVTNKVEWIVWIEQEHENIRAALTWTIETALIFMEKSQPPRIAGLGEITPVALYLRLVNSLWQFWLARGYYSEGRRWLEAGLACRGRLPFETEAEERKLNELVASILYGAGLVAFYQGQYSQAHAYYQESETLFRRVDYLPGLVTALGGLGQLARMIGHYNQARRYYSESLEVAQQMGQANFIASTMGNLGIAIWHQGEYQEAYDWLVKCLALSIKFNNHFGAGITKTGLGWACLTLARFEEAQTHFQEATSILQEFGHRRYLIANLLGLADLAIRKGELVLARRYLREGLLLNNINELDDKWFFSWYVETIASLALAESDYLQAAWLTGAASCIIETLNVPRICYVRELNEHNMQKLQAQLDETKLAAERNKGYLRAKTSSFPEEILSHLSSIESFDSL